MEEYTDFITILLAVGLIGIVWGLLTVFHRPFYDWADQTFWKDNSGLFDEKSSRQYSLSWGWRWIIVGLMFAGYSFYLLFLN